MNIVSIVTGTYNRLKHLKQMVDSVRFSVGARVFDSFIASGIGYEIVIVDGGSTDGTQEWCKQQADVKLIEHGKLLGAVKAFNDGAKAATGDYVILANDDIIFINESILSAIAFMQLNSKVGIGCFYQDRYGKAWHVEQMPAILNGQQMSHNYGQVCIVPRVLGNKVGWWGDYLRTYGGDNELSCQVLELGFDIKPIPCACIHDTTPDDELRKENNDKQIKNGVHPDTAKFVERWTQPNGQKGPIIGKRAGKFKFDTNRYVRCLYAPIYEPGYNLQHRTKRGLRDALAKYCLVVEVDYVKDSIQYLFDVASVFHPHLIITQIQSVDAHVNANVINALKQENSQAKFVNWNGDYHPEHLRSQSYLDLMKLYDLAGFCTADIRDLYLDMGVKWWYWQIGYEPADYNTGGLLRHDVVFLANGYSAARTELVGELLRNGLNIGLYGIGWPTEFGARENTLYDFNKGADIYSHSKIAIGDSQWPRAAGYVSNRLFQAMSAGVMYMQQAFDGIEEYLGLVDGEHLVVWNDVDDLMDKIEYYLEHNVERARIAANGQRFIQVNHSFDARVQELFSTLGWLDE